MRKVIVVIIAVLILSVPGIALAQMEKGEGMMDDKGMEAKGHGMKGGMKGCPMMKHMMGPHGHPNQRRRCCRCDG